ncbi:MAG: RecX family transcriptional regulator [Anaerolineae bacterium]|nr:RecX family transcriptional regulator [Anaerolineae bacterium]
MSKGVVTSLEIQKRNKERVNVHIDGEYAFSLSLMEAAQLRKGQVLGETEIARLRGEDAIIQAVDKAAHFLGYRPRSMAEVRRNLTEKDIPAEVIEAALTRLTDMGYLDDEAFARYWIQNRSEFKPLSQRALRQELRQKGLANAVIDTVLDEVPETDLAYKAALSRVRRLKRLSHKDFQTKMASFLQRRGFSYSVARDVIQRLFEELEAEDPDYFDQIRESDEE